MQILLKKTIAVVLVVIVVPTLSWAQAGTPAPSVTQLSTSFNLGPVAV